MTLFIYNTLTRKKEEFNPLKKGEVSIYSCGVTVYDDCHIGHARSLYIYDIFCRYLKYLGYKVRFVRNITDIDDKIIKRAQELKIEFDELSKKFIEKYYEDLKRLGIAKADKEPRATRHIKDIIKGITVLMEKGYAYEVGGDVYFRVRKFKDYGKLSGQSIEAMLEAVRIERDENKQDPLDFALWKKSKEREPKYESPWSDGRPGWHIECSIMSIKYLGQTFDIHAGGRDLIFPHHENEIAQSEALTGKPFARYWMHNGLLTVAGQKMSKSLGNFITIRDFLAKHSADVLKLFFLTTHYRSPIDYTEDKIENANKNKHQIEQFLSQHLKGRISDITDEDKKTVDAIIEQFNQALADDFNTPKALGFVFEAINLGSKYRAEDKKGAYEYLRRNLIRLLKIFGFSFTQHHQQSLNSRVYRLAERRLKARKDKDYKLADDLRLEIEKLGFTIVDTSSGYSLIPKGK